MPPSIGAIVYSIFTNIEPSQGWNHSQIIYVFGCIGGGLVLGAICWLFNPFLVFILGGVTGLAVALYVLAWRSQGLIRAKGGRIGLLVGAPILGFVLALLMGRKIFIPASVILGAYVTVIGIDLFARTGFSESIQKFFTTDSNVDYRLTTNLYIMLGVIGGLILLGLAFQLLAWRHRRQTLIAQGRSLHEYDHDWTILGRNQPTIRPDPTYPAGNYTSARGTSGYNVDESVYPEKRTWNPFKKSKEATTTPALHTEDNRARYSSNTALNQ